MRKHSGGSDVAACLRNVAQQLSKPNLTRKASVATSAFTPAGSQQCLPEYVLVPRLAATLDEKAGDNDAGADEKAVVTPLSAPRLAGSRAQAALRGMRGGNRVLKTRMTESYGLTSSAGGTIYTAAGIYANVMALGEFTDFGNLFDEFKVVSVHCHYIPFTPAKVEAAVNTNGRALVWAYDTNDATVPTGMQVLYSNETAEVFSNQQARSKRWGVSSSDPAVWFSTLSTTNPLVPAGSVKIAGDANLGTSTPVGAVYVEYEVHFRMRR
jgi:hypothetical protein